MIDNIDSRVLYILEREIQKLVKKEIYDSQMINQSQTSKKLYNQIKENDKAYK